MRRLLATLPVALRPLGLKKTTATAHVFVTESKRFGLARLLTWPAYRRNSQSRQYRPWQSSPREKYFPFALDTSANLRLCWLEIVKATPPARRGRAEANDAQMGWLCTFASGIEFAELAGYFPVIARCCSTQAIASTPFPLMLCLPVLVSVACGLLHARPHGQGNQHQCARHVMAGKRNSEAHESIRYHTGLAYIRSHAF